MVMHRAMLIQLRSGMKMKMEMEMGMEMEMDLDVKDHQQFSSNGRIEIIN